MKKKDIIVGKIYLAKVSGRVCKVKICKENSGGGWLAINTRTDRSVRIKTAGRLRGEVTNKEVEEEKEFRNWLEEKSYGN